jgi:hypothetical protein
MKTTQRQQNNKPKTYRKSLRLTFSVKKDKIELIKSERLGMICPPQIGELPDMQRNGGFWLELRGADKKAFFHRVLTNQLGNSVEVHSPDGKIERVFGEVEDHVFQVLDPDVPESKKAVLIGDPPDKEAADEKGKSRKKSRGARELASFKLSD